MEKVYVQVDSKKLESGEVVPVRVNWEDGRFWDVDRVIHSCKSLEEEYEGIRYTVIIGSAEKYIYRVCHKWYVITP